MFLHLPWPDAYAAADVIDVLDALDAIFDELSGEPIETFELSQILRRLAIKRMLKSCSRQSFQGNAFRFWRERGVGHLGFLRRPSVLWLVTNTARARILSANN